MNMKGWAVAGVALLLAVLPATLVAQHDEFEIGDRLSAGQGEAAAGFREIDWDDLIPPEWLPEDLVDELFADVDLAELDDYDPRAVEVMEKIRELWDAAPVVEAMNGQRVRVPGFIVPLEGDGNEIYEFLLVPYFGACIHVPPPPANQLIHVMPDAPVPADWNMIPVWVNGVITAARYDSEMGSSGYQMRGIEVEEYL